jgi:hypothetical protein
MPQALTRSRSVSSPPSPPKPRSSAPISAGVYYSNRLIIFEGVVSDGEDDATELVASWQSNLDGVLDVEAIPNADGEVIGTSYLSEGEHAIELNVSDSTGKTGTAIVIVQVGEAAGE